MEDDKRFFKGFLCGLCVTAVLGLAAYFISGQIVNSNLFNAGQESQKETLPNEKQTEELLKLDDGKVQKKIDEIEDVINQYYLNDADVERVETQLYKGLVKGLEDPYSNYYTKEEMEQLQESNAGTYSGIGAVMMQDKVTKLITIARCYDGFGAAEAGLLPGDILYKVENQDVSGLDLNQVVALIKEKKDGSVKMEVKREGSEEPVKAEVQVGAVEMPTVSSEMLDHKIGYIAISEFDGVTEKQFENALVKLEGESMEKLIIDLRNNPGGVLQVACKMLDQILPEGLIVYTEDKYGNKKEYKSDAEHQFTKPMVILVNGNSASASEVFAGAVKDYGIGTLVGTTTFGKGIVQGYKTLSDGTTLKLTIEKYYTPKGNNIHGVGINPDVEVKLDESLEKKVALNHEEDNQLQKAISVLEEK